MPGSSPSMQRETGEDAAPVRAPLPPSPRVSSPPWQVRLGRLAAAVWRFRTLPLAHRLFDGAPAPCILRRPLFGFDLLVDVSRSNAQRLIYLEGERFVGERFLLRRLLRPGMQVVDVGANIGYYLLLFESAVGPDGAVACFEPEPDNVRELRRNAENNGFANVTIFPVAAGREEGTAPLRSGMNGVIVPDGSPADLTVPVLRLDDALAGRRVDFIKVDVEGFEGHVLEGARGILQEHRPTLFVEIHPGFLSPPHTVDGILALLAETHPRIELFETAPQVGLMAKLRARYGGNLVRRVPDGDALLASCRQGWREEPFWAVCHAGRPLASRRTASR